MCDHKITILPQTVTESCASMPAAPVLRTFVQHVIAFCSRLEAASDAISGTLMRMDVSDKCVKFRDPRLNRSREIRPEAVGGRSLSYACRLSAALCIVAKRCNIGLWCVDVDKKCGDDILGRFRTSTNADRSSW